MYITFAGRSLLDSEDNGKEHTPFSLTATYSSVAVNCLFNRLVFAPEPPANAVILLPLSLGSQFCLVRHSLLLIGILPSPAPYRNAGAA